MSLFDTTWQPPHPDATALSGPRHHFSWAQLRALGQDADWSHQRVALVEMAPVARIATWWSLIWGGGCPIDGVEGLPGAPEDFLPSVGATSLVRGQLDRGLQLTQTQLQQPVSLPEGTRFVMLTSGSTGRPRAVCHSAQAMVWLAQAMAHSLDLQPDDRVALTVPTNHSYGRSWLLSTASVGASCWVPQTLVLASPKRTIHWAQEHAISCLPLVPYQVGRLLREPDFCSVSLPRIRRLTVAGGGMAVSMARELGERFPRAAVAMYGLTEAAPRVSCGRPGELLHSPEASGHLLEGVRARILPNGELAIRSPGLLLGYAGDDAGAQPVDADGWLATGDLARLDRDLLFLHGRTKHIIKAMGHSVPCLAVERVIVDAGLATVVVAVGLPDARRGERVALVVEGDAATDAALRAAIATHIGSSHIPGHIARWASIPRTTANKVLREAVRQRLLDGDG